MTTKLIGDIHGEFDTLRKICADDESIFIQLGDMGLGFGLDDQFPGDLNNMRFIRGNHDKPTTCRSQGSYLGDFGVHKGMFFVSGAYSVDKQLRTIGHTWWPGEEIHEPRWPDVIGLYCKTKPKVVISHTCPMTCLEQMYDRPKWTITGELLDKLFERYQPELWVFAHHHRSMQFRIGLTSFVALAEHEVYELEDATI